MSKKAVYSMFLFFVLMGVLGLSINVHRVQAPYPIIYIRADGSIDPATANITSSDNVTYTFTADINASIVIEKNDTVVDGAGYTVQGVGDQTGIGLSYTHNVTLQNVKVKNFTYGIYLYQSSNNTVTGNTASSNNYNGIYLHSSSNNTVSGNNASSNNGTGILLYNFSNNNTVSGNTASNNGGDGIFLFDSSYNTISGNTATLNGDAGISLDSSNNNSIIRNEITSNNNGVYLTKSSSNKIIKNNLTANHGIPIFNSHNNTLHKNSIEVTYIGIDIFGEYNIISGNTIMNCGTGVFFGSNAIYCTILGNIIENNDYGLYLEQTSNNSIVGNHIENNTYGLYLDWYSINMQIHHNTFNSNTNHMIPSNPNKPNFLDNGIEGNYWSNYSGVDLNHDGVGDTPHVIDANNTDRYPLMGMFHSFNTSVGKNVNIISNSTIESFEYEPSGTIRFYVSNMTANQTQGFCRLSIPYEVLSEPFNVTIDGANPTYWNYTLYDDGKNRWIYFEYEHTTQEVVIVPEFPSFFILPLFMIATLVALMFCRRRQST